MSSLYPLAVVEFGPLPVRASAGAVVVVNSTALPLGFTETFATRSFALSVRVFGPTCGRAAVSAGPTDPTGRARLWVAPPGFRLVRLRPPSFVCGARRPPPGGGPPPRRARR